MVLDYSTHHTMVLIRGVREQDIRVTFLFQQTFA